MYRFGVTLQPFVTHWRQISKKVQILFCVFIYQNHKIKLVDHAVTPLVEALGYKLEGRGFDSRWCHWHNYSGYTVTLGSTHALTEMRTEEVFWG
jgi:hypothetical protein